MRKITKAFAADPTIQRAATCASCRRKVAAVVFEVPIPKCAHCGGLLNEGEDGVIIDGDRLPYLAYRTDDAADLQKRQDDFKRIDGRRVA